MTRNLMNNPQSKLRIIYIPNGNDLVPYRIWPCVICEKEVGESDRYSLKGNAVYCRECGFLSGIMPERDFLKACGLSPDIFRAGIVDGSIVIRIGKNAPPQCQNDKQIRNSPEYNTWRMAVFVRDHFTCQKCSGVGTNLQAHHIKSFRKYVKLRLSVANGTTLCSSCHKAVHRGKKHL